MPTGVSSVTSTAPILCLVRYRSCVALQDVIKAEAVEPLSFRKKVPLRKLVSPLSYVFVTCPPCRHYIPTDRYTVIPLRKFGCSARLIRYVAPQVPKRPAASVNHALQPQQPNKKGAKKEDHIDPWYHYIARVPWPPYVAYPPVDCA